MKLTLSVAVLLLPSVAVAQFHDTDQLSTVRFVHVAALVSASPECQVSESGLTATAESLLSGAGTELTDDPTALPSGNRETYRISYCSTSRR